jgi:hypothetical protein
MMMRRRRSWRRLPRRLVRDWLEKRLITSRLSAALSGELIALGLELANEFINRDDSFALPRRLSSQRVKSRKMLPRVYGSTN